MNINLANLAALPLQHHSSSVGRALLLIVTGVILFAGLNSKNFDSADIPQLVSVPVSTELPTQTPGEAPAARIATDGEAPPAGVTLTSPGLEFSQYALAWTPALLSPDAANYLNKHGFTLEFELSYLPRAPDYFAILMLAHDGDGRRQLMVGQWRQWFVVMQTDDYKNSAGRRVLSADVSAQPVQNLTVRIELSESESELFFNNQLVSSQSGGVAVLPVPADVVAGADSSTRLDDPHDTAPDRNTVRFLLGNSATRTQGWPGRVFAWRVSAQSKAPASGSDAAIDPANTATAITADADAVVADSTPIPWLPFGFDFTQPDVAFPISSLAAGQVQAASPSGVKLQIVPRWRVPEAQLLSLSTDYFRRGVSSLGDIVLNFFGFMPFGLCCFLVLKRRGPVIGSLLASVMIAAAISLFIELAQTLIPSRYSTLFDVIFNTLGALTGAVSAWLLVRLWRYWHDEKQRARINGEVLDLRAKLLAQPDRGELR